MTDYENKKHYVIDTNVLLEDENCVENLYSNGDNVVVIPDIVLLELDRLKSDDRVGHLSRRAIDTIYKFGDKLLFTRYKRKNTLTEKNDIKIIFEIKDNFEEEFIKNYIFLITNDKLFRILCKREGINSEEYKDSHPFKTDSEKNTGIVSRREDAYLNSFFYEENKALKKTPDGIKDANYSVSCWKVNPFNKYQNFAFQLMMSDWIDLITLQSKAGYGKTMLSLAAAFQLVFQKVNKEKSKYEKIYILKSPCEIGPSMGFLPGSYEEKLEPYMKPIYELILKLDRIRKASRALQRKDGELIFNKEYLEVLPLAYIQGLNIENSVVIIDECQNISRDNMRSILTRMGGNVKCICIGDTNQVVNRFLNQNNNGLNWMVKKFINQPNYAHLVLKGERSRGPICDLTLKTDF